MKAQRFLRISILLAALLGGLPAFAPATAQEDKKKDDSPAGESREGSSPGEELDAAKLVPASETAESLRQKGTIVSQTGDLNISVDNNFYDKFPGFDLDELTEGQRDWLMKRANAVFCTCGCLGDTVARCVATDPTCETAREMLGKMLKQSAAMTEEELAAARAAAKKTSKPAN